MSKEIMDQLLLLRSNLFQSGKRKERNGYWSLLVKGFLEKNN
jgi:hypothetical protein